MKVLLAFTVLFLIVQVAVSQSRCRRWTQWFDRDNPSGQGDFENLSLLRKENPGKICERPTAIDVQTVFGVPHTATGETVTVSPTVGAYCINRLQSDRRCQDYRVRFCCEPVQPPPKCDQWTQWFDRDNPSATGDWETLTDLRKENPGKICEKPTAIDVQTVFGVPYTATGETLSVSPTSGAVCVNRIQADGRCQDYKVRFCCQPEKCKWTRWYDRDNPSVTGDYENLTNLRKENPGQICAKPSKIEAQLTDGRPYTAGNDNVSISPSTGLICINRNQSDRRCGDYKVRFCCA